MKFNTAILYDVENLIGGYGRADMLTNLSLKDIHNEILKKDIGKISIQRAYANWSDPRLNILRGDIIELGIEPVQMFGFGRGPQKNASDIQLAIDAIDIAFTRKTVEIFIIVSGDGGFSALAKKLHEYGKMVIGCAFAKTANRVFEAVCDDFIWIEEPRDEYSQAKGATDFTDPILIEFSKKFKPVNAKGKESVEKALEILNFFDENKEASYLLKNTGINISIFSQALSYRIIDFNYMTLGFTKFVDFIRYVTLKSRIKLIHNPPSEYRLIYQNSSVRGYEDVEPITSIGEIHTSENYKLLLSKGNPVFKLPPAEVFLSLAHHLSENKLDFQDLLLGDIIDNLGTQYPYEQNDIKSCILSLISSGCFMREPEDAKLSEQKLSFIHNSSEQAVNSLNQAMYAKLEGLLGNVKDSIFKKIFV
jgi:uncharacterized LabA/DUF88 family protein